MKLILHEFIELATKPLVWLSAIALALFLTYAVGHLRINDDKVVIAFYDTGVSKPDVEEQMRSVQATVQELSNVEVAEIKPLVKDMATQMVEDGADIAVTRTKDGWRLTLRSRSSLEHQRLVRAAQLLGATIVQKTPWFIIAYKELQAASNVDEKIQISGITADPGIHSRIFVAKVIVLIAYFMAFAIVSRSMMRDLASNMTPVLVVASGGDWVAYLLAKLLVGVFFGTMVFSSLLLFSSEIFGFGIKAGLSTILLVQFLWLSASSLVGVALAMIARTEARIYFLAFCYLILLIMLSGLIAKIDDEDVLLKAVSLVFPINYGMDIVSDWMFFGSVPSLSSNSVSALVALLVVSSAATYASFLIYRRTS